MLQLASIAIELTRRCNQRCSYCYNAWRNDDREQEADAPAAKICELVNRILSEAHVQRCTLTGGEPFLRQDIFDIIDHVNARGLRVAIISNGGMITPAIAANLAKRLVDYVQLTFAGPDAAAHDAVCGDGCFAKACAAVQTLVQHGVAVGGSYLCTRRNCDSASAVLELMRDLGIASHYAFNRFNPSGAGGSGMIELMPMRSEVLRALDGAQRFADTHDVHIHCTMPIPPCMVDESAYPRIRFGQCAVGTECAEYAIDPAGRLKLCTLQKHTIGSLWEHTLTELLAQNTAQRFRAAIPEFCRDCPQRETCLGGCGAAAEWVYGRPDDLDPFLGQHVRSPSSVARHSDVESSPGEHYSTSECRATFPRAGFNPSAAPEILISPLIDLIYHTLAHLPIAPDDASTLYDPAYIHWSAALPAPPRPAAERMARLYDESPQGHVLHCLPVLFDDLTDFAARARTPFARLVWPPPARRDLAESLLRAIHPELLDLLRQSLSEQLQSGWNEAWTRQVHPLTAAYRDFFALELAKLAEALPTLNDFDYALCLPLRRSGRLLWRGPARPLLIVGVAADTLGIPPMHPILQAAHEQFVAQAHTATTPSYPWSTRPGQSGHDAFQSVERAAVGAGARFFIGSPWEQAYRSWAQHTGIQSW